MIHRFGLTGFDLTFVKYLLKKFASWQLRFVTFGYLFYSWLDKVLPSWLSSLSISQYDTNSKSKTGDDDDVGPALRSTQEFAKITGKRAKKTEQFVQSLEIDLGPKLTMLSIIDEPLRFLTFYFLSVNDIASEKPTLIELTNESYSPLTLCNQYLASLLFGERGRTQLLWRRQSLLTVKQWEQSKPEQVRTFRRLVLLATAWIQRRHCDRLFQFPFLLCQLANENAETSLKQQILREWDSSFACCLRPGMARDLKMRGICGADLTSTK